jgi:hypothetical protein
MVFQDKRRNGSVLHSRLRCRDDLTPIRLYRDSYRADHQQRRPARGGPQIVATLAHTTLLHRRTNRALKRQASTMFTIANSFDAMKHTLLQSDHFLHHPKSQVLTIESPDTSKPVPALPLLHPALRQLDAIDIRNVPTGARTQDLVLSGIVA